MTAPKTLIGALMRGLDCIWRGWIVDKDSRQQRVSRNLRASKVGTNSLAASFQTVGNDGGHRFSKN